MMQFWKQECSAILIGVCFAYGMTVGSINMYGASIGPLEKFVMLLVLIGFMAWMLWDIRRKHT